MNLEATRLSPKVEIRSSGIHNLGIFSVEPISAGELVVHWGGDYVTAEQAQSAKQAGKLVMQWDTNLFSSEDRGENDGYFINHSCDGDLWMDGPYDLMARRDIPVGVEVTADYALWEDNIEKVSSWECHCGKPECRHRVTGKDWQLTSVREKYQGHFSPLINKRIELL